VLHHVESSLSAAHSELASVAALVKEGADMVVQSVEGLKGGMCHRTEDSKQMGSARRLSSGWLHLTLIETIKKHGKCQPNTGLWFLHRNQFTEWKMMGNSLIWIHGICELYVRDLWLSIIINFHWHSRMWQDCVMVWTMICDSDVTFISPHAS
jgi:hypothetical protein